MGVRCPEDDGRRGSRALVVLFRSKDDPNGFIRILHGKDGLAHRWIDLALQRAEGCRSKMGEMGRCGDFDPAGTAREVDSLRGGGFGNEIGPMETGRPSPGADALGLVRE